MHIDFHFSFAAVGRVGLFAVVLFGWSTAQSAPPYVSAKELIDSSETALSRSALLALITPGSVSNHMSIAAGREGWIRRWSNGADGNIDIGNVDIQGGWTGVAHGTWHVNEKGYYCLKINWKSDYEHWCRPVYRHGGALYLGRPNPKDPEHEMYGRLDITASESAMKLKDSDWKGRWDALVKPGPSSLGWAADVELTSDGGTWRFLSRALEKDNACLGRPFRIDDIERSDLMVSITIEASEVVPGCVDERIMLMKIDDKTLEGQLGTGGWVRLVRK